MSASKAYEKLDEIGFVGHQDARSKSAIKKDAKRTSDFIEAYKAKRRVGSIKKNGSKLALAS